MIKLEDRVAGVTGASRGAGRGIALALREAGATVYVGGRSTRANATTDGRPKTIEETAERGFSRDWKLCELPALLQKSVLMQKSEG